MTRLDYFPGGSDYFGATSAGLHALLLRRPESRDDEERKEPSADLTGVQTIQSLYEVVAWLSQRNGNPGYGDE